MTDTTPKRRPPTGRAAVNARKQFCSKGGHPITAGHPNCYRYVDSQGFYHRQCRTCRDTAARKRTGGSE
jgi:hypothetical protein